MTLLIALINICITGIILIFLLMGIIKIWNKELSLENIKTNQSKGDKK